MAQSYPDFMSTTNWQDLAAQPGYSAIANQKVTIQSKSTFSQLVFIGGASAPGEADGVALNAGRSVSGTSDHFWVKGAGRIAVLVED